MGSMPMASGSAGPAADAIDIDVIHGTRETMAATNAIINRRELFILQNFIYTIAGKGFAGNNIFVCAGGSVAQQAFHAVGRKNKYPVVQTMALSGGQ